MKRIVLVASVAISFAGMSQSLTQANEPSIGQSQNMYLCDSFATNYAGTTGAGVTWDYSTLAKYAGAIRTVTIEDATTTPNASYFPTSTKTIRVENSLTTYFNSTSTERVSQGFVFNEPSFGDLIAVFDGDEEKLVEYPFSNGSSLSDSYAGTLYFVFNGLPQSPAAAGDCYAWIDGLGTLELPDGSISANVIRYKMMDTSTTNIVLFGDLEIVRTQYEYYDLATSTLPLLTHSRLLIQQPGGGLPLADNTIVLSAALPDATVGIHSNELIVFEAYPNPTTGNVSLKGEFDADATVSVYDQSGRLLHTQDAINGASIDLSNYHTGMYLLKVSSNGATTTKTIVKQ